MTPGFTIIDAPNFKADPARHGTRSEVVIALSFAQRLVLIAGTSYAGEIKKSVFTILNCLLPHGGRPADALLGEHRFGGRYGALLRPLRHRQDDACRAMPIGRLIGDDEHGWSDRGVFNFEGGCYAKTIRLSAEAEPQIYATTRQFGTVLENVALDPVTRRLDLDDDRLTENTRAAYPISFIQNAQLAGLGGHPKNIDHADRRRLRRAAADFAADARGRDLSLPLRLHRQGGRDREGRHGADGDVQHLFRRAVSAAGRRAVTRRCSASASAKHEARVWLVNTGWTGGAYGTGRRMKISHTRAMIRAALAGELDAVAYDRDRGLQPRGADELPGRSQRSAEAAHDLGRRGGVRRASREAGAIVRGELQELRGGRDAGRASRGPSIEVTAYEPVIGLEIHAQLLTASKIFCGCSTAFGAAPNSHVCPVCLGLPGALPVLNRGAVDAAIRAGLALGCTIQERSIFARKNYFYPDLPKGYQISQYEQPLATAGVVAAGSDYWTPAYDIRITRVHMEEDAGKLLHEGFPDSERRSYVDLNRAGTPLIEIVTEPDLRTPRDAAAFFGYLRELLVAIGVNDGNMEEGSLRCDANVSVRPAGATALGTKAEIKNLNSFRFVEDAITYEIQRQIEACTAGERIVQETRLWDPAAKRTVSMRSKEEAHDYRYFPEPDLPPLVVDAARLATRSRPAAGAAGRAPAAADDGLCTVVRRRRDVDPGGARARRLFRRDRRGRRRRRAWPRTGCSVSYAPR